MKKKKKEKDEEVEEEEEEERKKEWNEGRTKQPENKLAAQVPMWQ